MNEQVHVNHSFDFPINIHRDTWSISNSQSTPGRVSRTQTPPPLRRRRPAAQSRDRPESITPPPGGGHPSPPLPVWRRQHIQWKGKHPNMRSASIFATAPPSPQAWGGGGGDHALFRDSPRGNRPATASINGRCRGVDDNGTEGGGGGGGGGS